MFKPSSINGASSSPLNKEGEVVPAGGRQDARDVLARLRERAASAAPQIPEPIIKPMPGAPLLNTRLTEVKFILLDTETTGADPETAHVIEIAAQGWSLSKKVKYPRVFETKVNPGTDIRIPPSSSAVHHITDEDVKNSPTLNDILPDLIEVIGENPIAAYNSEFDRGVLHGTPLHNHFWLDVYRLAMRTWYIGEENENGFPLTSFKQQELRYWLGLPHIEGDAHRAAADIMVTGLILQEAADKYLEAGLPDDFNRFVDWVYSPILHKTLPIGLFGTPGKTPDQLEDWQLRKMFDPSNHMYEAMLRFNVLDFARPEYMRRQLDRPQRGYGAK